ncbi:putative OmpL-like beta-barrel porin-2 [Dyadobacter jejuensis]|uniref:Putative OmpL-like beta-barrel porin-2 n=1 Tax=Dyadobacter jejuensis TaxID=1082580 RepID=A0A316APX6_9BACT|nr:porin [Dyadobacter jejuensis]PWJ58880.1 putative OmpL-like beta-barrel porin-2 [Dyadobacter jejuensis]
MKKVYCTVLSLMVSLLGFANTEGDKKNEKVTEAVTSVTEVQENEEVQGAFSFSGYLDSYYSANFNRPMSRSNTGASNARVFDIKSGEFQIGLVQAKVAYTNSKSEAVVDLTFGPNANMGNYGNALFSTALAIKQAYFTYNFSDKFSMTAGQFGTHIGYEVIDAPANFNYSLSNLFNNGPFYHTGLKATYAFSDRASLMVGVVNNVDGLGDNNRKKGIISQLYFAPVADWNVYLNFINSNEANPGADGKEPDAFYRVLDLTTSYQVSDKLLLGVNAAYGAQKGDYQGGGGPSDSESWGGFALYSNVSLSDNFGLGARYEYFNNDSGVRGLVNRAGMGTHVSSYTISGNISLADGHILVKPEFRLDAYPKLSGSNEAQQFEDSDGNFTKNSQTTFGMAFIYQF